MKSHLTGWKRAQASFAGPLALALCLCAGPVHAVVEDTEVSAQLLAEMIAVDSGGDASQYIVYARKLAKTMSQYPCEKQDEIFGFNLDAVMAAASDDWGVGGGDSMIASVGGGELGGGEVLMASVESGDEGGDEELEISSEGNNGIGDDPVASDAGNSGLGSGLRDFIGWVLGLLGFASCTRSRLPRFPVGAVKDQ